MTFGVLADIGTQCAVLGPHLVNSFERQLEHAA
jgi:hypothetical protein